MVGELQSVLVRRPDRAFGEADPQKWHYTEAIDLQAALAEHDMLVRILHDAGVEVTYHNTPLPDHADAIFAHDPVLICDKGAILLKMGKLLRRGEEEAMGKTLEQMGIPIHYRLHGDALAEAGDLLWLDPKTLLVGIGFRTNWEGLRQLKEALPDVEFVPVHLPYFTGPEACLHLGSIINFVDHDLAVVYESLMPVSFWQFLKSRNIRFVPVPDEEWDTLGPNVLALAPGKCLLLDVNKIIQARLRDAGCEVLTYVGNELSLKAEGGATCLTRPLLRNY